MTTLLATPVAEVSPRTRASNVRAALFAVVALALIVRVAAIVALGAYRPEVAIHGAMEHRPVAAALLAGDGFWFRDWGWYGPSSVQSPPYPLLVAAAYKIFGIDSAGAYAALLGVNALAGAATAWLAYLLVVAVGGPAVVGVVAAGLTAVWPTQVYAATFPQAIGLITAATLGVAVLWQRSMETGGVGPWVAFSVIGCLAALTEPVLLPAMALSGLLVLAWPSRGLTRGGRVRNAALLLLAAVAVIGPWTLRNRLVHGAFVPIKSTFWVNVWKGNNPHASGTDRPAMGAAQKAALLAGMTDEQRRDGEFDRLRQYDLIPPADRERLQGRTEAEREAVFAGWAKSWIAANPIDYARLCGVRLAKTLWVEWDNPKSYDRLYVYLSSRTLLLAATPVGLWLAWRRGWRVGYALVLAGTCLLTYVLTIAAARFALPFEPMQIGLAALVIGAAMKGGGRRAEGGGTEGPAVA